LKIPLKHQHTALAWGILGALLFRALFVFLGAAALDRWDGVRYVLAVLLLFAAVQAFREELDTEKDYRLVQRLSKYLRTSTDVRSNDFFVREDGGWRATPLLAAVVAIELSDLAFAIDSVPAALAISRDRFVVYSSNAFAILGLRALYLAIEAYLSRLRYLHYGLSAVLAFASLKLALEDAVPVPPLLSALVVLTCVGAAALASWIDRRRRPAVQTR
jgi:tellurite resistance protein TerC